MSGSLRRALGLWTAGQVDGLRIVSDELANKACRYPEGSLSEISIALKPLGCGRRDIKTRDSGTGHVDTTGKAYLETTTYRLVVSAPADREHAGQEIVDAVVATIERALLTANLNREPLVLTDTEADPPEAFELDSLKLVGRQPVPVDISGEPFVHRCALSLRVTRTVPIALPVEHVFERIHVEG